MAQRRMFSADIVSSDVFLEMPTSSRELYFQLGMYADDDGFVNPKKIMRIVSASDDDLKILLSKRFLLIFESGVVVIKHWLIHNLIRADRYKETTYTQEKKKLRINEWGAYTDRPEGEKLNDVKVKLLRQPNDNQMATKRQPRIGKVRIGKDKEIDVIVVPNLPDWLDQATWFSWELYQKEKRKTLTPRTIAMQMKLLEENKKDHVAIIEQSIRNGWTGLFPIKNNTKKKMYVA